MNAYQIGIEILAGERTLVDAFEAEGRLVVVTDSRAWDGLSERQFDVCRLAAQGHADKWIGYELGIARSTVATHLSAALDRLNLVGRTDLARVWPLLVGKADVTTITVKHRGRAFTALLGPRMEADIDGLTDAEQQVMAQAIRGASNGEIADRRGTSVRTVANQLASIYRKLGICSRSELAVVAAAG